MQEEIFQDNLFQDMTDIRFRSKALSEGIIRSMARSVLKDLKDTYSDQIDDNLAARKMNFMDQMSVLRQSLSYREFRFGFEDVMDDSVRAKIKGLTPEESFILECRDLCALSRESFESKVFSEVKDMVGVLLDEHYDTARMKKLREKFSWLLS